MTSKFSQTFILLLMCSVYSFAQTSTVGMTVVTEEVTKEIIKSEKKIITRKVSPKKQGSLQANIWPNPSNMGKVQLSVENLPEEPLFIQIFNDKDELIQEGVINGTSGASLNHTLNLPDSSGTYTIKLSNNIKDIKDLNLEIL